MAQSFTLGIPHLWDELQTVQTHGLYWLNIDRTQDVSGLCRQTILAQPESTHVTLIEAGHDIQVTSALAEDYSQGPASLPVYRLTPTLTALMALPDELTRLMGPASSLFILLLPATDLTTLSADGINRWINHIHRWLQRCNATLLVISHGAGTDILRNQLAPLNRLVSGLASLRWQLDRWLYDVAFWCNERGVSAQQNIPLTHTSQGWQANVETTLPPPQPHSDEDSYLAHAAILEGAPPLSEHWHLFTSNHELFTAALAAQAATLVFSLMQSDQVDDLARQIHTLRRQRGNALKIAVREQAVVQRSSDERLLLACGANVVIPLHATLSNALVSLEGLQGHTFLRHVPANITTLLDALRPLKLRGYQTKAQFCTLLLDLLDNPLIPHDGRGTLASLRPVSGIDAEQVLKLCNLRRDGDLVTLDGQSLVLFLAYCRPHELDTALRFIFPLPVEELFIHRRLWHQDAELMLELTRMRSETPTQGPPPESLPPQPVSAPADTAMPPPRRVPRRLTLGMTSREPSS
ncbi:MULTISPECIES: cellulose biosynthesis protein BcsE [Edwardsiella]|uniref:Cellulose biosynthesis protein BcsE n=1 Tax=Edwardsiella anguillarum TaxID=1821960 RepID=A0ABY8SE51_9GAMM|nr:MULTISPECIES: cellulose biosynthesis protein BcsE [Edwardsiella]AKR79137.1 cellulose biosynthesis protein BcsE [Edwardsiella sp. LADL05-105]KAB0591903.1 cellulose biosynthesis protein BcsE [Edwardsiella anguillarum]UOU79172.1 cellulose biosynthesis protein BcsE [Edwardsiella anguillarum]WHP83785.1 cellulose biosynthesis protein BcsE [Edwardsiella anguillarum]WHP87574.1 cellulose biosynthesis protein BcsE [Edwardsiella anguillarum]